MPPHRSRGHAFNGTRKPNARRARGDQGGQAHLGGAGGLQQLRLHIPEVGHHRRDGHLPRRVHACARCPHKHPSPQMPRTTRRAGWQKMCRTKRNKRARPRTERPVRRLVGGPGVRVGSRRQICWLAQPRDPVAPPGASPSDIVPSTSTSAGSRPSSL